MRQATATALAALAVLTGCQRHDDPSPPIVAPVVIAADVGPVPEVESSPDDLMPGDKVAFGLVMPVQTTLRLDAHDLKMFRVMAPMSRVMRYFQQRLEMSQADIHPLAAMIREASVRDAGVALVVDVGVRDEGDTTFVTVWNRSPSEAPQATARSLEEAMGVDPATGRVRPEFNH
ncbi:MAG: hypothetical protein R3A52_23810 [Polyangiales bacterium]